MFMRIWCNARMSSQLRECESIFNARAPWHVQLSPKLLLLVCKHATCLHDQDVPILQIPSSFQTEPFPYWLCHWFVCHSVLVTGNKQKDPASALSVLYPSPKFIGTAAVKLEYSLAFISKVSQYSSHHKNNHPQTVLDDPGLYTPRRALKSSCGFFLQLTTSTFWRTGFFVA